MRWALPVLVGWELVVVSVQTALRPRARSVMAERGFPMRPAREASGAELRQPRPPSQQLVGGLAGSAVLRLEECRSAGRSLFLDPRSAA